MNGYQQGAITDGIGRGINQAVSNILNLYGMKQRFDLQQQGLAIDQQNADSNTKRMHYTLASRFEREMGDDPSKWMTPSVRRTVPGGVGTPQANRLGVNQSIDADPRYLQPGADALLDY